MILNSDLWQPLLSHVCFPGCGAVPWLDPSNAYGVTMCHLWEPFASRVAVFQKSFPMCSFVPNHTVVFVYSMEDRLFWILSHDEGNCYEHTPASFGSHVCLFFSRNTPKWWSCESVIINTAKCFSMKVYYLMCHLQPWLPFSLSSCQHLPSSVFNFSHSLGSTWDILVVMSWLSLPSANN